MMVSVTFPRAAVTNATNWVALAAAVYCLVVLGPEVLNQGVGRAASF